MAIRRLKDSNEEIVKLNIDQDHAVLSFVSKTQLECLHLCEVGVDELRKLEQFDSPSQIKFVGPERILTLIEQMRFGWEKFQKVNLTNDKTEAFYYSDSGKIRIPVGVASRNKKVLIIDDSKTIQKILKRIIMESSELECMGCADDPIMAREMIEASRPDIITLDMHMPKMSGLEFLKTYLGAQKIPTVMITSLGMNEGTDVVDALANGAQSYIQKPAADKIGSQKLEIIECLESIAKINLHQNTFRSSLAINLKFSNINEGFITIGSSTGGTVALEKLFRALPDEIPPILVVQHIPPVFSKALADRLNQFCAFTVKEAEDSETVEPNTIYIAPGGKQMKVEIESK